MAAAISATSPFLLPTPPLVCAAGAQSAFDEETVDLLDEVQVFCLDQPAVPIYDLWKDQKAVVAFARHFGCALCGKRANYLEAKKDVIDDASGVSLVLTCPSNVEQQGGIIVAGPGNRNVSYIHKDKEAGDDPHIQEIIQACCS